MTTTPPRPAQQHDPTPPPAPRLSLWRGSILAPAAAGFATVCAATSLTGVVSGAAWLGYVIVAVVLVGCTGLALRSIRTPTPVVGLAQIAVLTFMVIGVFTDRGIAAIFPGPAAFSQLSDVLTSAFEQIRTGLPPVEASPPILCLVTIAIGLVAILVDTLAVAAAAPAATGLVLLCVYAVPAALSDNMLPWWTFLLGAAAFAALLAVDGNHRHRRWRTRDAPGTGTSPESASTPVAVVAIAVVLGLVAGTVVTAVGTVSRLPGAGRGGLAGGVGGLGVNPFTNLRGMLDQGSNVELFRVRGLGEDKRLLRAFTLDTYQPNKGWSLPGTPMPAGVPANLPLPAAPGDDGTSRSREIQIEPVNWTDVWMPVYGAPRRLTGVAPNWFYDQTSGSVYTTKRQSVAPYSEIASLAEPSKDDLRVSDVKPDEVSPMYTRIDPVDPRVAQLTQQITARESNNFDRASAIWRYFTAQNGFTYDTQTAPAADADALTDFLLKGKRGFCEQFASAMGVMLRVLKIPSRVAIGFTTGVPNGDHRTITSQDAHAWVEVYFGDRGWVSFDPTPLSDGRGVIPPYLRPDNSPTGPSASSGAGQPTNPSSRQAPTGVPAPPTASAGDPGQAGQQDDEPGWVGIAGLIALVLALAATAAAVLLASRGRRAGGQGGNSTEDAGISANSARGSPANGVTAWLPLVAGVLWLAAIGFAAWLLSGWLAIVLIVVLAAAGTPATLREIGRRRRLHAIAAHSPEAADAAWHELLDECADRGTPIPSSETARTAAQKLATEHHLDGDGRDGLRTVVGVLERRWYSGTETTDATLAPAFEDVRRSLRRNAPVSWKGRLLPKSLLNRFRR
ncbi:DUF3488 and transglutaminase-like domain-containing protein [Amycolatopsis minnesotensis]|uniref:DUF3488 and transglutaminase-like domain-containing protein n=1 Tax=Amycolatopsis minnesotensis TaxID=337894 RepID=A0ABN2Q6R4_9PSEU